ncbi:MAG: tripartite tricarboxylate transporter substrate binding protein [Betaproteobacteria bacterium]|jgi:tripartite-type tricarboxylate transporter receptor subunit TctC|nr:tripartite tricarboxylate transporter substrate binding protein [Betaproteobacteria bacterium]
MTLTRRRLLALAALAPLASRAMAQATAFPTKPVRIVVPYNVGLGPDVVARAVAASMEQAWGQSVIVENKPGAAGIIAMSEVKRAAPDGHTLFVGDAGSLAANPLIYRNLPYLVSDFAPLTTLFNATFVVWVRAGSPYRTLRELIDAARAQPEKISYASLGNGHPSQLAVESFAAAAGITLLHVPFKDAGAMMTAVATGDCDFTTLSANTSSGMVKAGKWRGLAVAAPSRLREYPEIPTIVEAGGPSVTMQPWAALLGVAGTPEPILDRIHKQTLAALNTPEIRARIEAAGFDVLPSTPAQLVERIRRDVATYTPLVASGRVRVE